jgi:hypothetical protein
MSSLVHIFKLLCIYLVLKNRQAFWRIGVLGDCHNLDKKFSEVIMSQSESLTQFTHPVVSSRAKIDFILLGIPCFHHMVLFCETSQYENTEILYSQNLATTYVKCSVSLWEKPWPMYHSNKQNKHKTLKSYSIL